MKYVRTDKSGADLVRVCDLALADLRAGDTTPEVGNVVFEHAVYMGWCQQHAREAVEACAYGYEGVWADTRCCATRTCQNLRSKGYEEVSLSHALPGDLIYWSPCGSHCGTCDQDAGHVGILHHKKDGVWQIWQNTSYRHLGMTIVPMQSWQHEPVGIFRVFPAGPNTVPANCRPALVVLNRQPLEDCAAWIEADGHMTLRPEPLLHELGLQSIVAGLKQNGILHPNGRAYAVELDAVVQPLGWKLAYRLQPQGHRLYPVPNTD